MYLADLQTTLAHLDPTPLIDFVQDCEGVLWLAGNGGSASIAQHWACDLSKAAARRAVALGSNPALLTAYANDHGYGNALADELLRLARPGDRLLCLSCSGRSKNIVTVLREAWLLKLSRAIVTGPDWPGVTPVDLVVNVPHANYGVIEDCFAALGHAITEALCSR